MNLLATRGRLLGSAALGLGLTMAAAQPAQAQCVVAPAATPVTGTVTCATTTTTDTTYAGVSPAVDRNYNVDTSAGNVTGTVSTGAVVDGFGLAFTNTVSGTNALNVVNNGTVQINTGNTATQGGTGALDISAIGATSVNYSGTGSIINLSTSGAGLAIDSTGTGNISAAIGGNVTNSSIFNYAVEVAQSGTAGNVSVTTAAGTTIRSPGGGIGAFVTNAASAGTVSITNNATIASPVATPNALQIGIAGVSLGTGAVSIANTGAIGTTTDRVTAAGIVGQIANAGSAAALSITGSGAIFSSGLGILASNAGTGTTTVNYTGAINTTGATGVDVDATTGATSVTVGSVTAATDAVTVDTTTGNQTIALNGVVTGTTGSGLVSTSTTGTRTITVGTAGNVTGGTQAILINGTGATTITNSGQIGALVTDLAINVTGGADTTIVNNATGTIRGDITLGGADDTITNAGTITAGDLNFGAGADLLTNSATGIITIAGATPILGLETFNQGGTLTAATGLTFDGGATVFTNTRTFNLTGALDMGAGADTFANTGATAVLNLGGNSSLVGIETFTQSGRINLNTFTLTGTGLAFTNAAGGFIDTSGSAGLAGFTSLSNAGTIDLAAGTLTVPAVTFTNTGLILADEGLSTITGQTNFANSGTIDLQDGAVGDILTINSGFVGSGASTLLIDFTGTDADRLVINGAASGSTTINANFLGGGFINLGGVLVVDATTATPNAFILGTVGGDTPLVDFSLIQSGGDFFLASAPTEAAFEPLSVPGFASDLWYQSADEVFAETVKPATTVGLSGWIEGYISRDRNGDDDQSASIDGGTFDFDTRLRTKRRGIQVGVDYGFAGGRIGLTGGYGRAEADGRGGADLKASGWNAGVYGQFGGLTGFHGEFLAKRDRYNGKFEDGPFDLEEFNIKSTGIDGSLGYRFGMGSAATVDFHAGLSHVRTKVEDIRAFGFEYDIDRLTSTRGRAGVRAIFGAGLSPYVDATVYREFNGDSDIELFDGASTFDLDTDGRATWVRFEAGLSGNDGPGPILAAWGDIGDRKGLGLRAGWRFGGAARVVEAAPPPVYVAPPPPPPPATQTCPDGSVILATDSCPPAPEPYVPPPPPPPAPERG